MSCAASQATRPQPPTRSPSRHFTSSPTFDSLRQPSTVPSERVNAFVASVASVASIGSIGSIGSNAIPSNASAAASARSSPSSVAAGSRKGARQVATVSLRTAGICCQSRRSRRSAAAIRDTPALPSRTVLSNPIIYQ